MADSLNTASPEATRLQNGFWLGDWYVEPLQNRLSRGDDAVKVEPKVMEVLLCLARQPGQTVTKEQFLEQVWAGTVVTEDVLTRCISELRRVFGDDARAPHIIETIRKRGYRLLVPVTPSEAPASAAAPPRPATNGTATAPENEAVPAPENGTAPEAATAPDPVTAPAAEATPGRWVRVHERVSEWIGVCLSPPVLWGLGVLIALVAGVIGFWAQPEAPAEPPRPVPLTSFPGEERDPALSPEGTHLAFVWSGPEGDDLELYVKQVGAETPLQLTDNAVEERYPAWSPDGQHLAFVRVEDGRYYVRVIPVIGGSERQVAEVGPRPIHGLDWSPDGPVLVLSAQEGPHGSARLYVLPLDQAVLRPLTDPGGASPGDRLPAFSPDGRFVAFVRSTSEAVQDLYVVPVQGGPARQITFDAAPITGVDWTADGRHLLIASQRGGDSALWRVPAEGGDPVWLAAASEGNSIQQLSVAHRAEHMAYVQRAYDVNIWRMTFPAGHRGTEALISSTRWDANPTISPTEDRIAFVSNRSGSHELWTCAPDGSDPLQVTSLPGALVHTPRWAPDGQRLAFVAHPEGRGDLFVMPAHGGPPRRLTTPPSDESAPSWSSDGQWLYFASNRTGQWQIWKMPADSGAATQVTVTGGRAAFESPDATTLYFVRPDTTGIWEMPLTGGAPRQVLDALKPEDWGNWAVVETGLYFVDRRATPPMLTFYDVRRGRTQPVVALDVMPDVAGLAVAPGQTWLLYTREDRKESDVLLVASPR